MRGNDYLQKDDDFPLRPGNFLVVTGHSVDGKPVATEFIRFEEKREQYIWARPDEIYFIKSADHYVKSLIRCGNRLTWMNRHSTLKELLDILPGNFIRLNRFYVLNVDYFSSFKEHEKLLYFKNDFFIPVPHRISPFLCHSLKTAHT